MRQTIEYPSECEIRNAICFFNANDVKHPKVINILFKCMMQKFHEKARPHSTTNPESDLII